MKAWWLALALTACNLGELSSLADEQTAAGGNAVTEQARWLWDNYDPSVSTDSEIIERMKTMDGIIDSTSSQESIGQLVIADLVSVGMEANDPTKAAGFLSITQIPCPLASVERYFLAANQSELYPGLYNTFARTYASSAADFVDGGAQLLNWTDSYSAAAFAYTYDAVETGSARLVAGANPDSGGPVLVSRWYLPTPATFTSGGSGGSFKQDYQIEVFYERTPGVTTHFYAFWRQFTLGAVVSSSSLYGSIALGLVSDYDAQTGQLCKSGTPAPIIPE